MHHAPPQQLVSPFSVVVDGREKAPYRFVGLRADRNRKRLPLVVPTIWGYLKSGDYSIPGYENEIAIERKTLADLYSTLGQHRERFEAEHARLAELRFAAVVIEADWPTILGNPPVRSKLPPKCVFRTFLSWSMRYGIHWWAMSSTALAEHTTYRLLEQFWKQRQRELQPIQEELFNGAIERGTD